MAGAAGLTRIPLSHPIGRRIHVAIRIRTRMVRVRIGYIGLTLRRQHTQCDQRGWSARNIVPWAVPRAGHYVTLAAGHGAVSARCLQVPLMGTHAWQRDIRVAVEVHGRCRLSQVAIDDVARTGCVTVAADCTADSRPRCR